MVQQSKKGPHRQKPRREFNERLRLVELWQSFGQTRRSFCTTHDISPGSFSRWLWEMSSKNKAQKIEAMDEVAKTEPSFAQFVGLKVADAEKQKKTEFEHERSVLIFLDRFLGIRFPKS